MMLNTVVFDDEIKVWWNYLKLNKGEKFAVSIDEQIYFTEKSHYNFKNLVADTSYKINLKVFDKNGNSVECLGECVVTTKKRKNKIDITKPPYNAVGDGITLNTKSIQQAIDDCGENDCVYIPNGTFLTGALNLKSNIELYLSDDATLLGSTEPSDYLPKIKSRFEGWEMLCYRSLLNSGEMDNSKGCDVENIIVRGGTILGGGNQLRVKTIETERASILKMCGMENETSPDALYSSVIPGRARGRTICSANTKGLIIANTVIGNAPAWNLHFIYCEDITVCSCKVVSQGISNGDGIDPDSTKKCLIFDIEFDTGDDCVAIKSGKNPEGYFIARPSEDIKVFDCLVKKGHGIAIGSEMSGGVSSVDIWNVNVELGHGINIKTRARRGGYVKNIKIFNCDVPQISISEYGNVDDGEPAPDIARVSDIVVEDVKLRGIKFFITCKDRQEPCQAIYINGQGKDNPVKNLSLKNITLKYRSMIPNQIIGLNNVENLSIENVSCEGTIS